MIYIRVRLGAWQQAVHNPGMYGHPVARLFNSHDDGGPLKRIDSVDTFRILAVTAVIALHTTPFAVNGWQTSGLFSPAVLINQFSRFAIPFFFVVSGYFWGAKVRTGADLAQVSVAMAKRLLLVFCAWSLIYLLPYNISSIFRHGLPGPVEITYARLSFAAREPFILLVEGTSVHLWFLTTLLTCLAISALLVAMNRVWILAGCSTLFYLVGVLAHAYVDTPLGIHLPLRNTSYDPFFGLIFFSSGYLLSGMAPHPSWLRKGAALVLLGYAVHFLELYFLNTYFRTSWNQDYVFGTYFVGIGCALIALSRPRFLNLPYLSSAGRMTLGIYSIHIIFVDLLFPIGQMTSSALWQAGYVFAVLALSITAVTLMARSKTLKPIVV